MSDEQQNEQRRQAIWKIYQILNNELKIIHKQDIREAREDVYFALSIFIELLYERKYI